MTNTLPVADAVDAELTMEVSATTMGVCWGTDGGAGMRNAQVDWLTTALKSLNITITWYVWR